MGALHMSAFDPKRTFRLAVLTHPYLAHSFVNCNWRLSRGSSTSGQNEERVMNYEAINFGKKFKLFDEQWRPKVIAKMNDYQFKIRETTGRFSLARSQEYR